jgi:hypothetical protein
MSCALYPPFRCISLHFPLFSAVKESDILRNVMNAIKGLFAIQIMGSELSASDVRFTFSLHATRDIGGRHV